MQVTASSFVQRARSAAAVLITVLACASAWAKNVPPTVSLTSPAGGTSYTTQQYIPLAASASDSDGSIAKVEFFAGTQLIITQTSAPYSFSWVGPGAPGTYSIKAKATDNGGASTTSTAVNITVTAAVSSAGITSPMNGQDIGQPLVDVSGSFGGDYLTLISVFNGADTVLAVQTGRSTYTASKVPLIPGANTLTATVLQTNGTTSTTSVTVNYPVLQAVVTSPTQGASYAAPPNLVLQASAQTTPGTIQRIEYYRNGGTLIGSASTPPYSYSWAAPPAGSHSITAKVVDSQGRTADSSPVSVTVTSANPPPTVSLTAPTNGATYQAPAAITLQANATATGSTISLVSFFSNGSLVGSTNIAPYAANLSALAAGSYTFTARATNSAGVSATSAPVSVTVTAPPAPSAPTVSLTAPAAGSRYTLPAAIQVSANAAATAAGASVARVEFKAVFAGSSVTQASATTSTSPYSANLNLTQGGSYVLTATATDSNGTSTTSAPVTIETTDGVTYLHHDLAGSPLAATDSQGNILWKEHYQPYGGRVVNAPAEAGNRIAFHGKVLDQDTGLSYFGARYYDPTLGRFMGVDPVGFAESNPQSFNRYAYGNNNPYRYADPNGMWAEDLVLALPGMYIGSRSLVDNIKQGNWAGAALDAAGLVTDGVALALPGVPGGAWLAIAATRAEWATSVAAQGTLAANRIAGKAAEARAAGDLVAEGNKILGSQVSVRTSEGIRVIDHLIQTQGGQIVAVEVKSGGAVRNARQLAKDGAMATEGGVVVGKNAPDALRGQQIAIPTIERRY